MPDRTSKWDVIMPDRSSKDGMTSCRIGPCKDGMSSVQDRSSKDGMTSCRIGPVKMG